MKEKTNRIVKAGSGKILRKCLPGILAALLLISAGAGLTRGYLSGISDAIVNRMSPAHVDCEVEETFDGEIKEDVSVKNTGDIRAFLRAKVVVSWVDANGEISGKTPMEKEDYSIRFAEDSGWIKGSDGFWYYTVPVDPGEKTGVLIEQCQGIEGKAPEGFHLAAEIIAGAIQSEPETAAEETWQVEVTNGKITGAGRTKGNPSGGGR